MGLGSFVRYAQKLRVLLGAPLYGPPRGFAVLEPARIEHKKSRDSARHGRNSSFFSGGTGAARSAIHQTYGTAADGYKKKRRSSTGEKRDPVAVRQAHAGKTAPKTKKMPDGEMREPRPASSGLCRPDEDREKEGNERREIKKTAAKTSILAGWSTTQRGARTAGEWGPRKYP